MRYFTLFLLIVSVVFPIQAKAQDIGEWITSSHYLWPEIEPYLPDSAHDVLARFHLGADGKEYIVVQYSYIVESFESQGLLIGDLGSELQDFRYGMGGTQQIESDVSDLWFFDKFEFASFTTDETQIDFLFTKGTWAAAGGSARGKFFKAYQLNEYSLLGPGEEYWDSPVTYGLRDCDFLIDPESNRVVVWIASPLTWSTLGYEPYPIKQYLYVYNELGLDLIRMDTTTELYSALPGSPPFDW